MFHAQFISEYISFPIFLFYLKALTLIKSHSMSLNLFPAENKLPFKTPWYTYLIEIHGRVYL